MAEETAQTTGTEETNGQASEGKEFQAITSQEDFDKAIQARIARERAKIPADYDDLKAKAAEFEKWQESQKTEAQKAQERLEAAEKRATELELKATRAEVAASKGVPVELLSGGTRDELEAAADALIKFKADANQAGYVAPNEGRGSGASGSSTADSFARFVEKQLN